MTTFSAVLAAQLATEPGRPLITFYDHASGERVELSVTTYANWVAKAASLLAEEHDLERGQSLAIDLPAHWLGPVFLGAAWALGLQLVAPEAAEPDLVVCGPEGVARWAEHADRLPVLACSLLPMGVRFAEPLPAGVHDVGVDIWSQPDAFTAWDPPEGDDPAYAAEEGVVSQADLWAAAAEGELLERGGRLLSLVNPATASGLATFAEPLARAGSLVLVAHPAADRLESTYADERCTARTPA